MEKLCIKVPFLSFPCGIFTQQGLHFSFCYLTAVLHKWHVAKRRIWLLVLRECHDDAQARLQCCLWRTWGGIFCRCFLPPPAVDWSAFMPVKKALLCLFSQTRRILLITPPQTKVLVIVVNKMLGSLVCPVMHVTWALSFSLPDSAALHPGRKTPGSFCAQDYQTCSYWKDTSFDLSCQNET